MKTARPCAFSAFDPRIPTPATPTPPPLESSGHSYTARTSVLWTLGGSWRWFVIVKLVLIVLYLPFVVRYMRVNYPRPFDPHTIPEDVLPKPQV